MKALCHIAGVIRNQSLETSLSRRIGSSLRFRSRNIVVRGCQSPKASLRSVNSFEKRCRTLSSAIKSRSAQGICRPKFSVNTEGFIPIRKDTHFVVIQGIQRIERLELDIMRASGSVISKERVIHGESTKIQSVGVSSSNLLGAKRNPSSPVLKF